MATTSSRLSGSEHPPAASRRCPELFAHLPSHPGAAFFVVIHLAPNRISLLPEILGRRTSMPSPLPPTACAIEKDHVYLIPPGAILTLAGGSLVLSQRLEERNPVDIMLASLAVDAGSDHSRHLLGHRDGRRGRREGRARGGGFTLAQGPDTKPQTHHGMPDAAIATGFVECVLPVNELAVRLAGYIERHGTGRRRIGAGLAARDVSMPAENTFTSCCAPGRSRFQRLQEKHLPAPAGAPHARAPHRRSGRILALVRAKPEELDLLFRDLFIRVTTFFRDMAYLDEAWPWSFPGCSTGKGQGDTIRVLGAGLRYRRGGVFHRHSAQRARRAGGTPRVRLQVFATDVDENALAIARAGRYPAKLLEGVSPERLERFFVREGKSYAIGKEIREICVFSCHSIIRDPPFSRIDLISCRNLLIYFNSELQNKVIPMFHYALRPGGFLFSGRRNMPASTTGCSRRWTSGPASSGAAIGPAAPPAFPVSASWGCIARRTRVVPDEPCPPTRTGCAPRNAR